MRRTRHVPSGHIKPPVLEPTEREGGFVGWSVGPAVSLVTARKEQVNQYLRPYCRHLLVQSSVVVAFPLRPGLLLGRPLSYRTVAKPPSRVPCLPPASCQATVDGAGSASSCGLGHCHDVCSPTSPFIPSLVDSPVPTLTPASSSCRRAGWTCRGTWKWCPRDSKERCTSFETWA